MHDGREIGLSQLARQGIDPDKDRHGPRLLQKCRDTLPSLGLARRSNSIFQIQDQGIGAGFERLHHPFGPIARNKQKRSQPHAMPLRINAVRKASQTISSFWLKARWRKVTIPESGRDRDARKDTTSVSTRIVSPMKTGLGMVTLS